VAEIIIFAPSRAGDALEQSRWMAECTIAALEAESRALDKVLDDRANRANLERALSQAGSGVVFFTHGRDATLATQRQKHGELPDDDMLVGVDSRPALDRDNLHLLRTRWVHAMACRCAVTDLPGLAVSQGATCFASYKGAIHLKWSPDEIPDGILESLRDLVVSTSLLLARGVRDEAALRKAAQRYADEIEGWLLEHDNRDIWSWIRTVQGLVRVTVVTPETTPPAIETQHPSGDDGT